MSAFLEIIKSFFITLQVLCMLLPGVITNKKSYDALNPDEILFNAVLVSDVHTDGNNVRDRNDHIRSCLAHINESKTKIDAFVCAGDITNAGEKIEYDNLRRMLKVYLKADDMIFAMGNHDAGCVSGGDIDCYLSSADAFKNFVSEYCDTADKVYYSKVSKGYHFICLGTEQGLQNEAYISPEQLEWLDAELSEAKKSEKPIFFICHQRFSSVGKQSKELQDILFSHASSYDKPILYLSGHHHNFEFKDWGNGLYELNMPSFIFQSGSSEFTGYGFMCEVYDHSVVLRERNFRTGEWIDENVYKIEY